MASTHPNHRISLDISAPHASAAARPNHWDRLPLATILGVLGLVLFYGVMTLGNHPLLDSIAAHRFSGLARPSALWAALGVLLLALRTALWLSYRPIRSATYSDAPSLTVVIPAFNEGPMVGRTIDSVARAGYPRDKLEIFVIDDGSRDDTWQHITRAAARYPGLVTALRFPENRGKRAGLEAGFRRARGEVIVTIDSDSTIEPGALLAIVGPFRDAKVGAVAGKVAVYNRREGLIPRMLHVRFALSFDLQRAIQSTYGTVVCCPGALAAYRTSVVRDVLDAWMGQTFLGAPCTYGEDRSMTNFILDRGFDTRYQRTAVVHTIVPTTYARLCKMYLRWDRSHVREELRFARILWKRPLPSRLVALLETFVTNLRYPIGYAGLALLGAATLRDPTALLRALGAIGVMSLFSMLYYVRGERSANFVYGIAYSYFSFAALLWIFPYAVLTVRSRSWMTR